MRPADLPDFGNPPINEVVLGVQFSNPVGYSQIHAGKVWELFQKDYPNVEEYMPLAPVFETFGPQIPSFGNQLSFVDGPLHDRYWFLNEHRDELIQFQQDRILHNWRKVGDHSNQYPRFERMMEKFTEELRKLEGYFSTLAPQQLQISQCEISYINHIAPASKESLNLSDWLSFVRFGSKHPQSLNLNFRETVVDANGEPCARMTCEIGEVLRLDGQRAISLSLTVRGAPKSSTSSSALDFLVDGRASIVKRFTELTTPEAHKAWERKV
jgi:uncharacterized protein (TIGR04255 family)